MDNPYSPPSSVARTGCSFAQRHDSAIAAARAGNKLAIRFLTHLFGVIALLFVVSFGGSIVHRGVVDGVWPAFDAPQFWMSLALLALIFIGLYFFACLLGCLVTSILFRFLYWISDFD